MGEEPIEVTRAVTEAVSDASGTPMEELPLLENSIDLDALNAVVTNGSSSDVLVSFTFAGLRVHVHSRDVVYARPAAGTTDEYSETENIN